MSGRWSYSIASKHPPASPQEVAECERALGVTFPDDYRRFLLTHNGGTPSPQSLDIPGTDHEVMVHTLYGVRESRRSGDLLFWHELHGPDLLPGLIPIGNDPGGNPFLLGTLGEQRGRVYFWDRAGLLPGTSPEENTYRLADSFAGLLGSLYDPEEKARGDEES